jgi:hypothetical protein
VAVSLAKRWFLDRSLAEGRKGVNRQGTASDGKEKPSTADA